MGTVDKFLLLLFTAIIVGIVVTNPGGIMGFFQGLTTFTAGTTNAFSSGFAGRTSSFSTLPSVSTF
jgi:hypothetical protein